MRTVTTVIGIKQPELLKRALESMGFTVEFYPGGLRYWGYHNETKQYHAGTYEDGDLNEQEARIDTAELKRKYAEAAVRKAAAANNWTVDKAGSGFEVSKKYGPFKKDVIKINILPDGTIKSETDKVSGPNHQSAESFLGDMAKKAGGQVTSRARGSGIPKQTHSNDQTETN